MAYLEDSILNLPPEQAKIFFLKNESYFNGDLPSYFTFENLLHEIDDILNGKKITDYYDENNKPNDCDNVNYKIITNKDGKYAWRPLQLIHPAIYIALLNLIVSPDNWRLIQNRFIKLQVNKNIHCMSIPVIQADTKKTQKSKQISTWIDNVEQESIKLSLEYEYLFITDITDCYPSIYTHTIAWALHGKLLAKEDRMKRKLLGSKIDSWMQAMSNGQTNGIPQGSILMDFIAEMVLGYADSELSNKIGDKIAKYKIIRYRDDYRIFTENQNDGEKILKYLTEVLLDLGLKINSNKTKMTKNIILDTFKPGKLEELLYKNNDNDHKRGLLQIYLLADRYPQSGAVQTLLTKYFKKFNVNPIKDNINVLLGIITDLSVKNPRLYPLAASIISKLFVKIDSNKAKNEYLDNIINKFSKNPNTGYMEVWLQRISYSFNQSKYYEERLCQILVDGNLNLWNSDWLKPSLKSIIKSEKIIDKEFLKTMKSVITNDEVDAFVIQYDNIVKQQDNGVTQS
jgi:hypothetical protein